MNWKTVSDATKRNVHLSHARSYRQAESNAPGSRDVVLHIGFHKSASTFLQKKLFPALPANYLFFAGENRAILDHAETTQDFNEQLIHEWMQKELDRKYCSSKYRTTILSHEELSGHPHGYDNICPFATARNLKRAFPKARVLIIVRNQWDYLASIYAFRVLRVGHESRSFERFVNEEGAKGMFNHLEYHRLVEYYHRLFGADHVLVLPMELLSKSPEEFCSQIRTFMHLPAGEINRQGPINATTKSTFILTCWRPINFFFGLVLNGLIYIMRKRKERYPLRRFRFYFYIMRSKITELVETKLFTARAIHMTDCSSYSKLQSRFGESNKQLEELLQTDLSSMGYPKAS